MEQTSNRIYDQMLQLEDIQLSDMFESYEQQSTPGFQSYITRKQEFAELASYPNEVLPKSEAFVPFLHQKFTHRILRAYPGLFIISETGSGKSCEVLGFTEFALDQLKKAKLNVGVVDDKVSHFRKVVVLVKNKTLKNDFRNQVICKCSDGHYITENLLKAKGQGRKGIITKVLIEAGYVLRTYGKFAKDIRERQAKGDYSYITEFSDTIFWIDEAHNLTSTDPTSNEESSKEKDETYRTLMDLFMNTARIKIIISTATPMINTTAELIKLLNLIPGPAIPETYDLDRASLTELEPFFRGRISYIRAPDTGVIAIEQQNTDHEDPRYDIPSSIYMKESKYEDNQVFISQTITYESIMSPFQTFSYRVAVDQAQGVGNRESFYLGRRQASNFVFPDGHWGGGTSSKATRQKGPKKGIITPASLYPTAEAIKPRVGFSRYVIPDGENFLASEDLQPFLQNVDIIRMMSCKYGSLIDLLANPGNAFVYEEEVEGSGTVILGLCLQGMGYAQYNESASAFNSLNNAVSDKYCSDAETSPKTRTIRIEKRLRYCIFTGKTSDARFASMIELFNSYENRHGDYIKVFVSSKVGRDGMNLNNVLNIHLMEGQWHQSGIYQALSRALRATSHTDLIKELRELGRLGMDEKLLIKIYKHAAIPGFLEGERIEDVDDKYKQSIDLKLYLTAEGKDRKIKRIMRMMKQCAVGCQIHRRRNIRPTDIDYTAACDYNICDYPCVEGNVTNQPRDYSTYNVFYAQESVPFLISKISSLYRSRNSITLSQLYEQLPEYRDNTYTIKLALEEIINTKVTIYDRFGYQNYLNEDHGIFFLQKTYPEKDDAYDISYYAEHMIGVKPETLDDISKEIMVGDIGQLTTQLGVMNPQQFNQYLDSLDTSRLSALVEESIIRFLTNTYNNITEAIRTRFASEIFHFKRPTGIINQITERISNQGIRRGPHEKEEKEDRRIAPIKQEQIDQIIAAGGLDMNRNDPDVYLHTVNLREEKITQSGARKRLQKLAGLIRILDTSKTPLRWESISQTNKVEYDTYRYLIKAQITTTDPLLKAKVKLYGRIEKGNLSIVDKRSDVAQSSGKTEHSGKLCSSWLIPDLYDIIWYLNIPLPPTLASFRYNEVSPGTRQGIEQELIENKAPGARQIMLEPEERIMYKYKWVAEKRSKVALCAIIQNYMIYNNLIGTV